MRIVRRVVVFLSLVLLISTSANAQVPPSGCSADDKKKSCNVVNPDPCAGKVDAAGQPAKCTYSITGFQKCKCKSIGPIKSCNWGWEVLPGGKGCVCNDKESRAKKCQRCKDKIKSLNNDSTQTALAIEEEEDLSFGDQLTPEGEQLQIPGQGQIPPIPKVTIPPIGGNCDNEGEIRDMSCMIEDYEDGKKKTTKSCEEEEFDMPPKTVGLPEAF